MATTLTPWRRSFGLLEPFRREMDELFERFFREEGGDGATFRAWAPRVDVKETDKEILVKADLPGVEAKDIEVTVADGVLTLRGEKKEEKEERKENYYRSERFAGRFYREIPLPPGADAEKVSAASTKGVVTITIPKKPEAQPKKIAVTPKD
jgi:HSP20 family protein